MEQQKREVDESWLHSALISYLRSTQNKGFAFLPCPAGLRPPKTAFNDERAWFIYLTLPEGGFIVDQSTIETGKHRGDMEPLITFLNYLLYLALAMLAMRALDAFPGWIMFLGVLISCVLLFVITPGLPFFLWELKVRRECHFVQFSEELRHLSSAFIDKSQQYGKWFSRRAKVLSGIAGIVAELFGGKVLGQIVELAVKEGMEQTVEERLSMQTKEIIKELERDYVNQRTGEQ